MIVRLVAVDPRPTLGHNDVLVYQVPENSREFKLLVELFESAHIEWVAIGSNHDKETKVKTPRQFLESLTAELVALEKGDYLTPAEAAVIKTAMEIGYPEEDEDENLLEILREHGVIK